MNYVAGKGLIKQESRSDLLGNQLVLIAPKDSAVTLDLKPGADLAKALGEGRLAIGLVDSVQPANMARPRSKSSDFGQALRASSRRPKASGRRCCWSRAARLPWVSSTKPTRFPIPACGS